MGVRLSFPPFSFDRDERVLRRDGTVVPLPPKAAQTLGLLLAEPGTLVAKEALRDALWPEGFVEDGNLTQTIYVIRRALDPGGDGRAFVETIPRRGYRFAPPVTTEPAPPRTRGARLPFALRTLAGAAAIAFAFGGVSIGGDAARVQRPLSGEAARAYALGRFAWNKRTEAATRASIAHFRAVIALAPNDPRGYAGLADAYGEAGDWGFTAIARTATAYGAAERYAHAALARDPHSGEAIATLGRVALQRDGDVDRAEAQLHTAIAYAPDHAPAYEMLGIVRLYRGDATGAQAALRRAIELDPLSPMNLVWYGKSLYYGRRFDEARAALRGLSELDAANLGAGETLALADLELGRGDEARAAIRSMATVWNHEGERREALAMMNALIDARTGRAPHVLPDLRPRANAHVDTSTASALCLALGRRDAAIAWLEIGMRDRRARSERGLIALDPRLASLRGDERFQALVAGIG